MSIRTQSTWSNCIFLVMELVRQDFDPGGGRHSSFSDIILNSHSTNQLSSQVAKVRIAHYGKTPSRPFLIVP